MPMIPTQPNYNLISSGNQLEVKASIQKEKKWDMLIDQIEGWLNTMSIHMQEQQRQGQIEEAYDMQQEVYPKDQNVNLPIQEPYEFNYKDPYGDFHHSAPSFDQLSPTIEM